MSEVEEFRNSFAKKLERMRSDHEKDLDEALSDLHQAFSWKPVSVDELLNEIGRFTGIKAASLQGPPPLPLRRQALVNMTHSDPLKALDELFFSTFSLSSYYSIDRLSYPTIFCESLEEFFTPFLADLNFSDQARRAELQRLLEEAADTAEKYQGGIFGVNFPGRGCYLNGWLFAKLAHLSPLDVPNHPEVFNRVLSTAAHEKLGHGFLSSYSALGKLKTELGLSLTQIASRFGMHAADDPMMQLRSQQNSILFDVSQFLEEGWATYIENFIEIEILHTADQPRHSLQSVLATMSSLPREVKDSMMQAMGLLFSPEPASMGNLLQAVNYLGFMGEKYDEYFTSANRQPLRYVIGQLLCIQCAVNCGEECVPYAALMAANVTFDPAVISLSDLEVLLKKDPRLNPDARLAAISRIKLDHPGDIQELAARVSSELSLSIPPELKK